ncbi:MAG: hypothetical protein ACR2LJ_00535 [Acidimicrobiales bacterium]
MAPKAKPGSDEPGRLLLVFGLLVGVCANLPVLVGPHLGVAHKVEIADHLIPGVVVLAVSVTGLVVSRSGQPSGVVVFAAGLVITLAGLWMVLTHLPLVAQATRHDAPWGATLYHTTSAVLVFAFGLAWTKTSWARVE